ncbi:helicase C-terminal domain-containing protein [Endogone sp. FLAS-F59071]|nr:helicase C-terminal domain-containing protein [Endogone sp. FLAS-F59071]|eukprot:RUS17736.1 helicase C-terminal domain-containing protein [Endogone sp. FLAS-F59071]
MQLMYEDDSSALEEPPLPTPTDMKDFQFPYNPYPIQQDFMSHLYETIEQRKIGVFESPTGTGKSLSLICGSLKWLQDHARRYDGTVAPGAKSAVASNGSDEPDWILAYDAELKRKNQKDALTTYREELEARIRRVREQEEKERRASVKHWRKKQRLSSSKDADGPTAPLSIDSDSEFVLEEYHSDNEGESEGSGGLKPKVTMPDDVADNLSKEVKDLMRRLQEQEHQSISPTASGHRQYFDEENLEPDEPKIYYASRTHSQLTQFLHEVRKTAWAANLRAVPLGSRANLCINQEVRKLGSVQRMNERCLEMQKAGTKLEDRCPHLPTKDKSRMLDFRDHTLARIRDIEDLVELGQKLNACPYYGTRRSIRPAQLVTLPYHLLLHLPSRASLGLTLRNHIVLVDEAHNLPDTVSAVHTCRVPLRVVVLAREQLEQYLARYKARLKGRNMVYIRQILGVLRGVERLVGKWVKERKEKEGDKMVTAGWFVKEAGVDHLNLFKIEKWLRSSQVARKLNGFVGKVQQEQQTQQQSNPSSNTTTPSGVSPLSQVESFLTALTHAETDGRVIMCAGDPADEEPYIKYILLNPANAFRDVVDDARSVVLAGGTMEPVAALLDHLFPYVPPDRVSHFSCGHVIPPGNLVALAVAEGPSGIPLEFTFDKRGDVKLVSELGQTVVNLCRLIPDGVVCFFASYAYLEQVTRLWEGKGGVLERIGTRKKVFREPRQASEVEQTLREYAQSIDASPPGSPSGGALLLCVVGGKMSEGINFSDQLGRGVIMIGLPFANLGSAELAEKMRHVQERPGAALNAAKEYYENLCMRAVNQSIGRAIRHRNDYAVIVLLDRRFCGPHMRAKLPGWINERVEECTRFGKVVGMVAGFFKKWRVQEDGDAIEG